MKGYLLFVVEDLSNQYLFGSRNIHNNLQLQLDHDYHEHGLFLLGPTEEAPESCLCW